MLPGVCLCGASFKSSQTEAQIGIQNLIRSGKQTDRKGTLLEDLMLISNLVLSEFLDLSRQSSSALDTWNVRTDLTVATCGTNDTLCFV